MNDGFTQERVLVCTPKQIGSLLVPLIMEESVGACFSERLNELVVDLMIPFLTDFFVHDNCFLREPVGVPNPVGDDRKE